MTVDLKGNVRLNINQSHYTGQNWFNYYLVYNQKGIDFAQFTCDDIKYVLVFDGYNQLGEAGSNGHVSLYQDYTK